MMSEVKLVHFTVEAENVVKLCRDAWLYENKSEWAYKTLGYLAMGLPVSDIEAILNGVKTLKSTEDKLGCYLVEETDAEWQKETADYRAREDYLNIEIAGIKVNRQLVETYASDIVGRIRNTLKVSGAVQSPTIMRDLYDVELRRREMHEAIFRDAGFTKKDIFAFRDGDGSPEITEFAYQLTLYVDKYTSDSIPEES